MSRDLIVSFMAGAPAIPGWSVVQVGSPWVAPPRLPEHDRLVLFGFSAGCQAVRAHLTAGVKADAVVCIDGVSDQWPTMLAQRIAMWRKLADEARRGERVFVLTHTRNTYTEKLPKPFASTLSVARAISGMPLDEPDARHVEGNFAVWSSPSGDCDPEAHRYQARVIAPEALRWAIGRLDGVSPTIPPPPSAPPRTGLGARALARGLEFLGTHEVGGPKANPVIAGWLGRCERGGRRIGLASDEIAWCAAFASACAYDVAEGDEKPPHGYRASVAEVWADAMASGTMREASWQPSPGDLAIFGRDGGDPRRGGTGHVARVLDAPDPTGRFRTLDGNHGNEVAIVDRARDASLLGWIAYPATQVEPVAAFGSAERAAELVALSDAVWRGAGGLPVLEELGA